MAILNSATVELVEQMIGAVTLNEEYKGERANEAAIIAAYATGEINWIVYNTDTASNWAWNDVLGEWVNKTITYTDYKVLRTTNAAAAGGVAYNVTVG